MCVCVQVWWSPLCRRTSGLSPACPLTVPHEPCRQLTAWGGVGECVIQTSGAEIRPDAPILSFATRRQVLHPTGGVCPIVFSQDIFFLLHQILVFLAHNNICTFFRFSILHSECLLRYIQHFTHFTLFIANNSHFYEIYLPSSIDGEYVVIRGKWGFVGQGVHIGDNGGDSFF